ncbi:MAG: porin family protein [Gemmatimonadota bacterium]|nr:porin family protein [Gemmatimonadota bacterium]
MTIRSFLPHAFAVSALLAPASLAAQTSLSVGGGITLAKVQLSADGLDVTPDSRMGLTVGVSMTKPLSETVDLQLGGAYVQKGFKVSLDFFGETVEGDLKLDYLELTALAKPSFPMDGEMSFHVLGGPALGVSMGCSSTEGEETEDCSDDFASLDLGVLVGAGVQMGSFRVDAAYTLGIMDVNDADEDPASIKNRSMSIQAAYVIPLGGGSR